MPKLPRLTDGTLLLSIVRTPQTLMVVRSRRRSAFVPPGEPGALPLSLLYLVERLPLRAADRKLLPQHDALVAAWDRLGEVRDLEVSVLADCLLVLLSRSTAEDAPAPSLQLDAPSAPLRATAAHRRAFRGTKYRPPKAKRMRPPALRRFSPDGHGRIIGPPRRRVA
jgi:hypothetical protein